MAKQRYTRTLTVKVEVCERCKSSHEFPAELIFDEETEVIGLMGGYENDTYDVVFACPTTDKNIVVSVPVSLGNLQTIVRIQPKT
jgi:hypothetical protein